MSSTVPPRVSEDPGPDGLSDPSREEALARLAAVAARRALLLGSGLFDADWYRRHHPPAVRSDLEPLDHYLTHGVAARAAPGPLFDPDAYLRRIWYLRPGIDDPLTHFLEHGLAEGRRATSLCQAGGGDPLGRPVEALSSLPAVSHQLTIAVVVHVHYLELFDEICTALGRLPYRVSLLVTTDEADKAERIARAVAACGLDVTLAVRVGPNRGRNFGPFLTLFRDAIAAHQLVLHLHTKKSVYTGSELAAWRGTLLRTLLPAAPVINGYVERFVQDPALGVLTVAATGAETRHWAYHWLSNRHLAQPLFDRLGLDRPVPRGAFDYPMGGMFWARTEALGALLARDWRIEEFPVELGQADGTLMHAVERVIVLAAASDGYGFAELDYERGLCRPGWSSRGLDQYRATSQATLLGAIGQVDTVSFDVFDTVLTRLSLSPDTLHRFIGVMAARRYPGADDYVARRQAAETALRADQGGQGDIDLDQIQARFRRDAGPGWSEAAIRFVQDEELALDARLLLPRDAVLEALRQAHALGRRIILASDSPLSRPMLEPILERFGILKLCDALYLSADRRARKDRGDLWQLITTLEQDQAPPGRHGGRRRLLHVGDNEQSDIQQTADRGISPVHVMSPAALLSLHGLSPEPGPDGTRPLGDEILLGPIAARLFNSPWLDQRPAGPVLLDRPEQAGAVLFGPLLLAFVAWLVRHPTTPHLRRLFFASREGFFLKRLYDAVRGIVGPETLPPSTYFHSSRRAALAALQGLGLDPGPVLRGAGYHGTLADFFLARLGFVPEPALCHQHATIALPRDADLVRCVMELMQGEIEAHGRRSLAAFTDYAARSGITDPGPVGFVDVGYSGTMQAAIQATLGRPLIGLYMGVSQDAAQVRGAGGHAFGAFADGDVADFTGGYGLMLEAFLTAPHGQVTGYETTDGVPAPLFRSEGGSQRHFALLERIYDGVEDYALTLLRCYGPDLLQVPFRPATATAMLQAVRDGRLALSSGLMAALSVEDDFCGNGEIPVFSLLSKPAPRRLP